MVGLLSETHAANQLLAQMGLSLPDLAGKRCLDIGSGDCFLGYVCKRYNQVFATQSGGINLISIDKAPGGAPGSHSYVSEAMFVKADVVRLPFPSSCFDLVISRWAPPTVCFPDTTIREIESCCNEIMRVLKEGGEFRFCPDLLAGKYYQPIRVPKEEKGRIRAKMDERSATAVWRKSREILQMMLPGITFSRPTMATDYDAESSFCIVPKPGGSPGDKKIVQSVFTVILTGVDAARKVSAMKIIREITGLGLKEIKDFVEGVPKPVKENISKEEALKLKSQLEHGGAIVEIK
jgi:large subunit ribosomal protein L7/L12